MGKIWDTTEWKESIDGKKKDECEWCNSEGSLCLHHETSYTEWINFYVMCLVLEKIYEETGKIYSILKQEVIEKYVEKYPEIKEKAGKLAKEKYLSLDGTVTLCNRCHCAWHMGLILCQYCNKKYYNPKKYNCCSDCGKIENKEWKEKKELFKKKITEENMNYRERIKKIIEKHPYAYQPWSEKEERILLNLFRKNFSHDEIAERLKRQPSAITSRLKKLNKISP